MNQQSSANQSNAEHNAFNIGDVFPEQLRHSKASPISSERTSNRVDLTMLSLVSALLAIGLTLMIALITPGEPVLQRPVETSIVAPDQPVTSTIEVPSPPVDDKRFMNGLEVEPAPPAATDPFARRGSRK